MVLATALLLAWVLTAFWIALAPGLGLGKRVRAEGPEAHLAKAGTPSMGGVAFLLAAALAYGLHGGDAFRGLWLLGLGFALLGAVDDLAGSRLRPLRAREKLLAQGVMGLVFALWALGLVNYTPWPWLDVLLILLAVVGAANAFNFTDGLDGLLASVTAVILLPFYPYPWPRPYWAGCWASSGTTPPGPRSSWGTRGARPWGPWWRGSSSSRGSSGSCPSPPSSPWWRCSRWWPRWPTSGARGGASSA